MPSERIQRQIDDLLDEAAAAVRQADWTAVRQAAQSALMFDPKNEDALTYLDAADRLMTIEYDREEVSA